MDYYSVPRRILRGARQLVYPRRCPFCDRVLGSVPVCPDCAAELEDDTVLEITLRGDKII